MRIHTKGKLDMVKIKRIGIAGFRRLKDVDIEMRPMMALIGANGVGKTSFMDALSLLSASARGALNQHLNSLGGFFSVRTRGLSETITWYADVDFPNEEPLKYTLQLAPQAPGFYISQEQLAQKIDNFPFQYIRSQNGVGEYYDPQGKRYVPPKWRYITHESALFQMHKMSTQAGYIWQILDNVAHYHILDVSRSAPIKLPQQLRPAVLPGQNGEDLAPFLYNLRETDHDKFDVIEDSLKAAFPKFEALSFPSIAAGMIAMTWKEKSFRNPFYINELSEGTLRFLWLASLLQSPQLPTITMIDEPEVSMHPELLALLADLMREASARTQIIVATHSDRLVRFLNPSEVVVMDVDDDGGASMTWGDSLELDEWLKEYSLDEVWQMGRMGGRS